MIICISSNCWFTAPAHGNLFIFERTISYTMRTVIVSYLDFFFFFFKLVGGDKNNQRKMDFLLHVLQEF